MPRINASLAIAGSLLVGCGLEVPAPRVAPPPKAEATVAVTDEAVVAEYSFNPVGKRDPFQEQKRGPTGPIAGKGAPTELQKFELDALHLKFTSASGSDSFATVVDPTGEDHIVRVGEFIGKSWGKVSRITRESIEITQTMTNEEGRVYPMTTSLRMPASNESGSGKMKVVPL